MSEFTVVDLDDPQFLRARKRREISEVVIKLHDIAREYNDVSLRAVADKISESYLGVSVESE